MLYCYSLSLGKGEVSEQLTIDTGLKGLVVEKQKVNLPVDSIGVVFIEADDALIQFVAALAFLDGQNEEVDVGIQGELVHGVHTAHVVQHKEQDGRSLGTWTVPLSTNHVEDYSRMVCDNPVYRPCWRLQYNSTVCGSPVYRPRWRLQ